MVGVDVVDVVVDVVDVVDVFDVDVVGVDVVAAAKGHGGVCSSSGA